jgi:hypothetical protein
MSQLDFIAIELDRILCSFSYEPHEFRWYLHPGRVRRTPDESLAPNLGA